MNMQVEDNYGEQRLGGGQTKLGDKPADLSREPGHCDDEIEEIGADQDGDDHCGRGHRALDRLPQQL
jgi:hypothetical protein